MLRGKVGEWRHHLPTLSCTRVYYACARMHTCTHACTYARARTYDTHTHTHAHTHAHTCAHIPAGCGGQVSAAAACHPAFFGKDKELAEKAQCPVALLPAKGDAMESLKEVSLSLSLVAVLGKGRGHAPTLDSCNCSA